MNETPEEAVITFGYVPTLGPGTGTLMPRTGGVTGVEYAQVCTHHIVKAKRDPDGSWGPIVDAEPYVISGPDGDAEVVLLCKGEPIRGASSLAGAQICKIDREIYTLTGFKDPDDVEEPTKKPAGTESKGKDLKGTTGIQARQPSV